MLPDGLMVAVPVGPTKHRVEFHIVREYPVVLLPLIVCMYTVPCELPSLVSTKPEATALGTLVMLAMKYPVIGSNSCQTLYAVDPDPTLGPCATSHACVPYSWIVWNWSTMAKFNVSLVSLCHTSSPVRKSTAFQPGVPPALVRVVGVLGYTL